MSNGAIKRLNEILEQEVGNTGKKVLLVEGEDDVKVYSMMLDRKFDKWKDNWIITHANGKQKVIDILKEQPTWLGLVDRDEWSEERISQAENISPNLMILQRFCMENYLICPDELWEMLPERKQKIITGGLSKLQEEILNNKDEWVRHGVLWSVINPLWEGIKELGFKGKLLDIDNAQDNDKIKETLHGWHNFLEPEIIFNKFEERLLSIMEENDEAKQLKQWIHGKKFYNECVSKVLNQFLGQESADNRREKL
ncbi:MAG: DUF4435 domain-containing protein [Candidatus Marithrix sp.]